VGHSAGGFDVTVAADLALPNEIRHIIYLAAGLPWEGHTVLDVTGGAAVRDEAGNVRITRLMENSNSISRFVRLNAQGRMVWTSKEGARECFYHDCDDETVEWAFSMLTPASTDGVHEKIHLRNFWLANLPRSYILCEQDRAMPQWLSAQVCDRLGVVPLRIDSSHSPFLSKPAELAALMLEAVDTRPVGPLRPTVHPPFV